MYSILSISMPRPLRDSHSVTERRAEAAQSVAILWVGPVAKMEPSSTYVERLWNFHDSASQRSGVRYMAERMGESGDPWGVPWLRSRAGLSLPLMVSVTC